MKSDKKDPDADLFREAMEGVRPLGPTGRIDPEPPNTPPEAVQLEKDNRRALAKLMEPGEPETHETGEELLYLKPGYQRVSRAYFPAK